MRCDVNLSVRKKGEQKMGTRTEMKNLNSFQFIMKAIAYEFARQVEAVEAGRALLRRRDGLTRSLAKPSLCAARKTQMITGIFRIRISCPLWLAKRKCGALRRAFPNCPTRARRDTLSNSALLLPRLKFW